MRNIIYLFNSFSKFYQPCLVHLLTLLLHLLPESCSPGPALCWFHREGSLGFWCWSGWWHTFPISLPLPFALPAPSLFPLILSVSAFRSIPFVMTGPIYPRWALLWGDPCIPICLWLPWFLHRKPHVRGHPQSLANWKDWSVWCWINCSWQVVV